MTTRGKSVDVYMSGDIRNDVRAMLCMHTCKNANIIINIRRGETSKARQPAVVSAPGPPHRRDGAAILCAFRGPLESAAGRAAKSSDYDLSGVPGRRAPIVNHKTAICARRILSGERKIVRAISERTRSRRRGEGSTIWFARHLCA
ncbi:hypothetical protein LSAT2_004457 [Lamellibrachia satsuma]|nr:hypothetical protein LSAT2_004457 [Lamellibrachia satsuma]